MAKEADHGGIPLPAGGVKGPTEGPSSYNGSKAPTSAELSAPVKIYPGASKLPKAPGKGLIEGPCSEHGGYHK
jgi:hypothetical protein